MQLHDARKGNLSNKKKFRVGRGPSSGAGKTAGRGIKGATSRSGYTMKVTYEGGQMPLFRRLPKRGFRNGAFRVTYSVLNIADLADFKAGSKIGPDELRAAGVLQGPATWPVKVLGNGDLKVALTVSADAFSKSAVEKIQKAGGTAEWIGGPPKKPAPNFKRIDEEKKRVATAAAKAAEKK
jgi:large subunit ribosomal protein L15